MQKLENCRLKKILRSLLQDHRVIKIYERNSLSIALFILIRKISKKIDTLPKSFSNFQSMSFIKFEPHKSFMTTPAKNDC